MTKAFEMTKNRLSVWYFCCQKFIPLVYDDSLSYYEVLCKIVEMSQEIINNQGDISSILDQYGTEIESIKNEFDTLQAELDAIKNGEYMGQYIEALQRWIDANIADLVGRIVKYVFFGLSQDGHFVAHIPESWEFMKFETCVDYSSPLYGHLIMRW